MSKENKVEIYSRKWCPYCRRAKAFFKSKGLSYIEYDIEKDRQFEPIMIERSNGDASVPQIFINDEHIGGYEKLLEKSNSNDKLLGISSDEYFNKMWDLIIIGAGPAGLTAAVYAARMGFDLLVLASDMGGQVLETDSVDNYMAKYGVEGGELMSNFWDHANQYNISALIGEQAAEIKAEDDTRIIVTKSGKTLTSKAIIIASGTHKRHMGVDRESKLNGKGVHYCNICDGYMYAGKPVAVVGGGNSGFEAALDLAKLGCKVTIVELSDKLAADQFLQDKVSENSDIDVITGYGVDSLKGKDKLESIIIKKSDSTYYMELKVDAVFVEIGLTPNTEFCGNFIKLNRRKEIEISQTNSTNIPGIWAAGDVTDIRYKQIIISAAEGAKAALSMKNYLSED